MLKGTKEFQENLKKVEDWTDEKITRALEISANNVVTHAKSNHLFWKALDRLALMEHPHKRFYTRTSELVNSIRAGEVQFFPGGQKIEVKAAMEYAAAVELGGPNRRAYPFLGPALKATAKKNLEIMAEAIRSVTR